VVEAPTGIGKSLAYLLPLSSAGVRGSGPVVVSTCTKALQEQLFRHDVPIACRAIGSPLRVVTLKGRQNYLCRRHAKRVSASARSSLRMGSIPPSWTRYAPGRSGP